MEMPSIEEKGWKDEEGRITPIWFLTKQLPLQKRRIKAKEGYIPDSEAQEEDVSLKVTSLEE